MIQWVNIDVEKGHLDLRVIYVKIYLLVRAYIMIGSHTFISLVEIYLSVSNVEITCQSILVWTSRRLLQFLGSTEICFLE